jgi:hypothetical protein
MTIEKFITEINTLKTFYSKYCHDKHTHQNNISKQLKYKDECHVIDLSLCLTCMELIDYSFDRLIECPHEIKPRCRKCLNPCYEKTKWKRVAKLMRYSGIQLGILKIKNYLHKI